MRVVEPIRKAGRKRPKSAAAAPPVRRPVPATSVPAQGAGVPNMAGTQRMGRPGQASEREAGRLADRAVAAGPTSRQPIAPTSRAEAGGAQAPSIVQGVIDRPGALLDGAARAFMEDRFGRDLGDVRIHDDGLAAESARAVKARAYAAGHHIVFNSGEYAPGEPEGKWLLAHELAHTLQPGAEAVLQRYEGYEHVALGDEAKGDKGRLILLNCHKWDFPKSERDKPVSDWPKEWQERWSKYDENQRRAVQFGLTYGEVVALVGDLYPTFEALSDAGLREVIDLIPLVRNAATTTAQFQEATGGRYLDLAKKNVGHFSLGPGGKAGAAGSNMAIWREQHRLAIGWARGGFADMAWGINAGADHFLTDAFSGGHIRTPRADLMKDDMQSVQSLVLHNLDNIYGVEVSNKRGDKPWIAYGDKLLNHKSNKDGRAKALEAVELSKKDIAEALAKKEAYPEPTAGTVYEAEQLVPSALKPKVDRWTGRPKKGVLPDKDGDYKSMFAYIAASEGPGIAKESFDTADDQVVSWVSRADAAELKRTPGKEKIRMLNTLVSGIISEADMLAIERLLGAVTTSAEMTQIKGGFPDTKIFNWNYNARIEKALARKF